jgi:putative cell wall-binding protein
LPYRIAIALVAALMVATSTLLTATAAPVVASSGPKVAIIVGPVGSLSNTYRTMADRVADAAVAAGASVAKAYSPSATWPNVKAAVNNANVVVYFGHGNGFPNPYGSTQNTDRVNGWGLNTATTNGDADSWSNGTLVYCGEKALLGTLASADGAAQRQYCGGVNAGPVTPAPGFTMVYAQAHYAPGFGERYVQSTPLTTLTEAQQRVRNYSRPILALGGTYLATAYGDAHEIVTRLLTQGSSTYGDIFRAGRGYSPSTLTDMGHPDHASSRVWVQRTSISGLHFGEPDYWYAFAGDPNRTPGSADSLVTRLAGSDRFGTAAAVSSAHYAQNVPVAYVATGANFADALAAGPAAIRQGGPVLLVSHNRIPSPTMLELTRLRPAVIRVVGGAGVISDGVLDALRPYATTGAVERLAGADRYATAAAVSAATFARGVPVAYIATGGNFPDALAGVGTAGRNGGPILLVRSESVPAATAAELARLAPGRIVVLGGSGAVSDSVIAALAAYTPGNVQRLAGADRFATSVAISAATFTKSQTVYLATGRTFPDALGGGPASATLPGALLLVNSTSIPPVVAAELQRLGPERVVILGGTGAVSADVITQVRTLVAP